MVASHRQRPARVWYGPSAGDCIELVTNFTCCLACACARISAGDMPRNFSSTSCSAYSWSSKSTSDGRPIA